MEDEEIPASPSHSRHKRKRIPKCTRVQSKQFKGNNSSVDGEDGSSHTQQSSQIIICQSATNSYSNVNGGSPRKLLTRNDILQHAHLMERANVSPLPQINRPVLNKPTKFLSVSEVIASGSSTSGGRFKERCELSSKFTTNPQNNVMMESECGVSDTQLFKIVDEAEKQFGVTEAKSPDTASDETTLTVDSIIVAERREESDSRLTTIAASDVIAFNAFGKMKRHSSIVQSILDDWPSPVKRNDTKCEEWHSSPKFVISRRIRKTYSRKRRTANESSASEKPFEVVNIPSSSASSCSAIAWESDDEKDGRKNNCFTERYATNSVADEIDLNKSLNVIDNLKNLSKFYSQPIEMADENDVNETFKLVMELKCRNVESFGVPQPNPSQSLINEEEFLGFDINYTLSENFHAFSNSSIDKFSVWSKSSSVSIKSEAANFSPNRKYHDYLQDDDDLFANFQTQKNGANVCAKDLLASTSSASVQQATGQPLNRNVLRDLSSKSINMNPLNFDEHRPGLLIFDTPTTSIAAPDVVPMFKYLPPFSNKFEGFRTASTGAEIRIPEYGKKRRKNLFEDIERECGLEIPRTSAHDSLLKESSKAVFVSDSLHAGFVTAWVNPIPVSLASRSKYSKIFDEVIVSEPKTKVLFEDSSHAGFETARGNPIPVSMASRSKYSKIFDDVSEPNTKMANNLFDDIEREFKTEIGLPKGSVQDFPKLVRFSRAGVDTISNQTNAQCSTSIVNQCLVSMMSISKSEKIYDNVLRPDMSTHESIDETKQDFETEFLQSNRFPDKNVEWSKSNSARPVFSTARGKQIPVSMAAISKLSKILDEAKVDESFSDSLDLCIPTKSSSNDNTFRKSTLLKEVTNSLNYRESTLVNEDEAKGKSDVKATINIQKFDEERVKENVAAGLNSSVPSKNDETPKLNLQTPKTSDFTVFCTPKMYSKTLTQEARESAEVLLQDDRITFLGKESSSADLSDGYHMAFASTPINTNSNSRIRPRQIRLVEQFENIACDDCGYSSSLVKFKIPKHVLSERRRATKEQCQSIISKVNVSPLPSTLYMRKLISSKATWKDFVKNKRPINGVSDSKILKSVLTLTLDNAMKFKFNALDLFSDEFCRQDTGGIRLNDNINVVMDENCQIGLSEISNAFLSCPTVDPKLIHNKWIENNLRWILIKLSAMERSFPDQLGGQVLTLDNVMLQLKYRYDREIDRVERSAIRKICEMDDVPARRMILFVARIVNANEVCELELSDGWYSLLSTLDKPLTKFVTNGKIKVGTKLITQGAVVTGLDSGCSPLDVPSNVRLKIFANSTRRARWDATLGYCKYSGPFAISLKSVLEDGGRITKLRICILRVYPLVYLDMANKSCIHSEKVERRRTINEEQNYFDFVEKIYSQVCREYKNEKKSDRTEDSSKTFPRQAEISKITDPEMLYNLLENSNDPNYIECEMTKSQKTIVEDYKAKLNSKRNDEIASIVNERLASFNKTKLRSVALLKFKVMDEKSLERTATVTIWSPSEEQSLLIKEGTAFEITNSSAKGTKGSELQIYAGKSTIFKKLDDHQYQVPESHRRQHLSILKISSITRPMFDELDTVGFVVVVSDKTSKMQSVYIADQDYNILCINFWDSLKAHAYDDIVQSKRFLAITNLQWRSMSSTTSIRCTFASEFSVFTENPKSQELFYAITNLKMKFEKIDIDEFMKICLKKISEIKSCKSTIETPFRSSTSLSIQSSESSLTRTPSDMLPTSSHSALTNKSRIERLSRYGNPSPTPPLHIKRVTNSFKAPLTTE